MARNLSSQPRDLKADVFCAHAGNCFSVSCCLVSLGVGSAILCFFGEIRSCGESSLWTWGIFEKKEMKNMLWLFYIYLGVTSNFVFF